MDAIEGGIHAGGAATAGAPAVAPAYTRSELMVIAASRALREGEVVFVGIGLPNLACNLAQRVHAPSLELVYESGVFGAMPERQALSIGDPCLVAGAAMVCSLSDIFLFYLQRGFIDVGFLGAAELDRYGNINTTVIGDYANPKTRLPGSGGASEITTLARRVFVIVRQSKRTFVEKVSFITSAGRPGGARPEGAMGGGPELVITDLAVYGFDPTSGQMVIRSLHPGVTYEEVCAQSSFGIPRPEHLDVTAAPTAEELRILRDELDPNGYYLK